jgi:hypothetical protein
MKPPKKRERSVIPLKVLQTVVSDSTRWRIFDVLQSHGPMTTEFIARAIQANMTNVSKHLVFLRKFGVLEHRMARVYAIPDDYLVPGERVVDFGPIVLRFDRVEA